MLYAFADKDKEKLTWKQLQHAILRNFGGMDDIDPVEFFTKKLVTVNICERVNNKFYYIFSSHTCPG